jgi:uncharacterized protein YdaU (DUF1376 family)
MNYYEKHIGDYIRDTVSLTMMEDGAYGRLLDQLYQSERALPIDKDELYRLARATNPLERKAVDYVLAKFFTATDEGYTQKRAQTVIEAYWDREPAQETKRENAKIRQQRTRDRRKSLFEQLRALGVTPEFNVSMRHLEAELSRVTKQNNHAGHNTVTRDNTFTQPPTPNPQSPVLKTDASDDSTDSGSASAGDMAEGGQPHEAILPTREKPPLNADPAVQLTVALRRQGVNVMSTNPHLMQWVADGVTLEQLTEAVAVARETKGETVKIAPGYLVPIVDKIRNPPAVAPGTNGQARENNAWAASNQGIDAKCRELGIRLLPSHNYADARQLCYDEIRKRKGQP